LTPAVNEASLVVLGNEKPLPLPLDPLEPEDPDDPEEPDEPDDPEEPDDPVEPDEPVLPELPELPEVPPVPPVLPVDPVLLLLPAEQPLPLTKADPPGLGPALHLGVPVVSQKHVAPG